MLATEIFDLRVNRLISLGRVLLASVSLLATWLDPARSDFGTYALLAGYTIYSLAMLMSQWSGRLQSDDWSILAHLIDLLVFTVLLYLTDGPTSPFFPLLVFGLLAATLRWQWQGALWTTLLLLVLFVAMGLSADPPLFASELAVQRFMIRTTQLAVVGGILTFFGFYQARIGHDLLRIHTPLPDPGSAETPIATVLRYAADIYRAERAILAWSDPEEPWLFLTEWSRGELTESSVAPNQFDPMVATSLAERPFVYRKGRGALYRAPDGRLAAHDDEPIDRSFIERFGIRRAVVLPITAQGIEGWLFIPVKRALPLEALTIAEVLDTRITAALDRAAALAANAKATASEQRLRLARDLHDGILQFLAGSAMQLESIITAADDPAEHLDRLRGLQDALTVEQRELRTFIRRLRPGSVQPLSGVIALRPDLAALVERLESQWRVNIYLTVHPPELLVPASLHYDIHQLVREAVANAVRHGHSRWINISANSDDSLLHLTVSDDGHGLGHHGTFDTHQLVELGIGPRSLRERVQSLGGTIAVTSASLGLLVCMSVPLASHGGRGA